MKLNLGAADRQFPEFESVDIVPPADWVVDLEGLWPWQDSSVEEVLAFDIAEHIGPSAYYGSRYGALVKPLDGRIHFMNELHRVLKPGSIATIEVPNATKGSGFAQDPTHKTPWCMNSFQYFEAGSFAHQRFAKAYGITAAFDVLSLTESSWQEKYEITWKVKAVLRAVK